MASYIRMLGTVFVACVIIVAGVKQTSKHSFAKDLPHPIQAENFHSKSGIQRVTSVGRIQKNPNFQVAFVQGFEQEFRMLVHDPEECIYISKALLEKHAFEPDLVADVLTALNTSRPNGVFLDIGSNIGTYSLAAAQAGYSVVALEPLQYNTELQITSAAINGLDHLYLYKTAVSENDDTEDVCILPVGSGAKNQGNGQIHPLSDCYTADIPSLEIVPVHSIDAILQSYHKNLDIAVVKADVEGYELRAFEGALKTVFRPDKLPCQVFFEIWTAYVERAGRSVDQLMNFFHSRHYTCYVHRPRDSSWQTPALSWENGNYRCENQIAPGCFDTRV